MRPASPVSGTQTVSTRVKPNHVYTLYKPHRKTASTVRLRTNPFAHPRRTGRSPTLGVGALFCCPLTTLLPLVVGRW
nr:MAG TPA: hypothetical protein [Bacteriophage sp.]